MATFIAMKKHQINNKDYKKPVPLEEWENFSAETARNLVGLLPWQIRSSY